ncbi:hypothetical protein Tco_0417742 [Tanacetum coccineum]
MFLRFLKGFSSSLFLFKGSYKKQMREVNTSGQDCFRLGWPMRKNNKKTNQSDTKVEVSSSDNSMDVIFQNPSVFVDSVTAGFSTPLLTLIDANVTNKPPKSTPPVPAESQNFKAAERMVSPPRTVVSTRNSLFTVVINKLSSRGVSGSKSVVLVRIGNEDEVPCTTKLSKFRPRETFLAFEDRNDKLILHKESAEENYVPVDCDIVRLHMILWKLQPTSVEMKINFIRAIAQESYVRTAPGTIEQPIEVGSERVTRIVGVQREEEEPILQDQSTIFVLSDSKQYIHGIHECRMFYMDLDALSYLHSVRLFGAQFTSDYLCFKQALAAQFATEALLDETWTSKCCNETSDLTLAEKRSKSLEQPADAIGL